MKTFEADNGERLLYYSQENYRGNQVVKQELNLTSGSLYLEQTWKSALDLPVMVGLISIALCKFLWCFQVHKTKAISRKVDIVGLIFTLSKQSEFYLYSHPYTGIEMDFKLRNPYYSKTGGM